MDTVEDGLKKKLEDIDPFTFFGLFNKGIKNENRQLIMKELATLLEIQEVVPDSFDGIPVLNNMSAWFFGYEKNKERIQTSIIYGNYLR